VLDQPLTSSTLLTSSDLEQILKKDLRFLLVFLAPSVSPHTHMDDIEDLATQHLVSKSEFRALRNSLLKSEHWKLSAQGHLQVAKGHIDLGELSAHEFTNMCLGMLTHLSEEGPCNYENLFVATTPELKKEFYAEVNRALKNFIEKSREASGDRLVGWAHMGVDFGNLNDGTMTEMTPFGKET
jgi:hypothetical protein